MIAEAMTVRVRVRVRALRLEVHQRLTHSKNNHLETSLIAQRNSITTKSYIQKQSCII